MIEKAIIDGDASNYLVVKNHDGEESLINIDPSSCRARSGKLRCTLDAVHKALGTKHLARTPEGQLVTF